MVMKTCIVTEVKNKQTKRFLSSCSLVNGDTLIWDNPRNVGIFDPSCQCYRGDSMGWRSFIKHYDLRRRNYLKNDDLIIFVDFEGMLH